MTGARINGGDIVFIRSQQDVDDGDIAAVILNDKAALKQVYHIPNGLQPLPMNPCYAPMVFSFDNCEFHTHPGQGRGLSEPAVSAQRGASKPSRFRGPHYPDTGLSP